MTESVLGLFLFPNSSLPTKRAGNYQSPITNRIGHPVKSFIQCAKLPLDHQHFIMHFIFVAYKELILSINNYNEDL